MHLEYDSNMHRFGLILMLLPGILGLTTPAGATESAPVAVQGQAPRLTADDPDLGTELLGRSAPAWTSARVGFKRL